MPSVVRMAVVNARPEPKCRSESRLAASGCRAPALQYRAVHAMPSRSSHNDSLAPPRRSLRKAARFASRSCRTGRLRVRPRAATCEQLVCVGLRKHLQFRGWRVKQFLDDTGVIEFRHRMETRHPRTDFLCECNAPFECTAWVVVDWNEDVCKHVGVPWAASLPWCAAQTPALIATQAAIVV